ncbi:hypothetical protein [Rhizobium sp. CSW-27]|uniref:hypothetical protein n=1 Tax=Rhizobium sp. CSW-27 TaxID=2839985 RepID=UPI001C029D6D|nr:hypothetical protein [Rhizobium sp. CSW-27]MBT9372554.1 hypothetical protein [Rhizobium sp. CSW-27]
MFNIHFFKAGKHTSASGAEVTFAEADLREIANSYRPELHEAPIVVGHPSDSAPAFGWVESVKHAADGLHAIPTQVNLEFRELVKSGTYKKVSASFYPKNHPNNPTPGSWYLRHIGFLGGAAPAVKGLTGVEFSDGGELLFSDIDVFDLREHSLSERERALQRENARVGVKKALDEGRLPIGLYQQALAFAEALDPRATFDFSEEGENSQVATQEWFLEFLSKIPVPVVTGDLATGPLDFEEGQFDAPSGYSADSQKLEIDRLANHHMRQNGGSYWGAVRLVEKQLRK